MVVSNRGPSPLLLHLSYQEAFPVTGSLDRPTTHVELVSHHMPSFFSNYIFLSLNHKIINDLRFYVT